MRPVRRRREWRRRVVTDLRPLSEPEGAGRLADVNGYHRVLTGQCISAFGSELTQFALPLVVALLTGSAFAIGAVASAGAAGAVLFSLPAGSVVDRIDTKRACVVAECTQAVIAALLVVTIVADVHAVAVYCALSFTVGGVTAVTYPATSKFMRTLVGDRLLPDAMARQQGLGFVIASTAPAVAGLMIQLGRSIPFLIDCLSFAISALLFLLVPRFRAVPAPPDADAGTSEGPVATRVVTRVLRPLSGLFLSIFLVGVGASGLLVGILVTLTRQHTAPTLIGALFTIGAVAAIAGSFACPWLRRRYSDKALLLSISWSMGVALPLLALNGGTTAVAGIIIVGFALSPIGEVIISSTIMAQVPLDYQGRASSVLYLLSGIAGVGGPVLASLLVSGSSGYTALIVLALAFTGAAGVVSLSKLRFAEPR